MVTDGQKIAQNPHLSRAGKIFLYVFLIVIFEGALRKWIAAELSMPIVAARDLLVTYGIYWAIKNRKLSLLDPAFKALMLWTMTLITWGCIQSIFIQGSPITFVVGLRFWLLYLWFGYAASVTMTREDFNYLIKVMIYLLILTTPLIILQFYSSPGDFINKQIDDDPDKVFRLTADKVRTTGLFSFTLGQSLFLSILGPFVFFVQDAKNSAQVNLSVFTAKIAFICFLICVALSGSRTTLLMFLVQLFVFLFASAAFNKGSFKIDVKKILGLVFILLAIVIIPILLPDMLDATSERVLSANDAESPVERILTIFAGDPEIFDKLSWIGYGLGAGTNFAGVLSNTEFALGETETSRILMEAGFLGGLYVFIKLVVGLWAIAKSILIAKRYSNILPIVLWSTMLLALLTWSIIGQLSANAMGYILFGICLLSLQTKQSSQ